MGWAVGSDDKWQRDVGYGVPAICDHPDCDEHIDRGLSYVCGAAPFGEDKGCGLYFCAAHQVGLDQKCERCRDGKPPFTPKPDVARWTHHKETDPSWAKWRKERDILAREQGE